MKFERLGNIASIGVGQGAPQKETDYSDKGIPFIRAGHLEDLLNGKDELSLPKISEETAKRYKLKLYPKGTIVFAKSGMSAAKGRIYQLKYSCYLVNHLAIVDLDKNVNSDYIVFALRKYSPVRLINDSAYPSINQSAIEKFEIPFPSLPDQLHIANILSRAENLIAQRKESIRLLDEYLKSTFLEMFGDPIKNVKNWCLERLDKISKLQRGRFSPRPRNDPSYYVGKYPFIQTGDISKSENRLRTFNQTLNEKGIKVSKEFKKGTIVIAIVGATIGATAILEIDVYATDSIIGITAKSDLTNEYFLEFTLRFWKPVLLKNAPEAARANINLDILNKLKIAIPPIELQTHFSHIVEKTEALKAQYQRSLQELEHLYGSLSQRAFKGDLSAKDEEMLMAAEPQEDYITKQ